MELRGGSGELEALQSRGIPRFSAPIPQQWNREFAHRHQGIGFSHQGAGAQQTQNLFPARECWFKSGQGHHFEASS